MSLDTLLEAARYLEIQEQQQQQLQQQQQQLLLKKPDSNATATTTTTTATTTTGFVKKPIQHIICSTQAVVVNPTTNNVPNDVAPFVNATPTIAPFSRDKDGNQPTLKVIKKTFDIHPLIIDEKTVPVGGRDNNKRKQPPLVFRAGTREVHNKLEKNRRAHLKECFDFLKKQLPTSKEDKKTSNLNILHLAIHTIQALKRREKDLEHEMERLARDKIAAQQKLAVLKKEVAMLGLSVVDAEGNASNVELNNRPIKRKASFENNNLKRSKSNDSVNGNDDENGHDAENNNNNNKIVVSASTNNANEKTFYLSSPSQSPFNNNNNNNNVRKPPHLTTIVAPVVNGIPEFLNNNVIHGSLEKAQFITAATTASAAASSLSVLPVPVAAAPAGYPSAGLLLHKVALVPKDLAQLTPIGATVAGNPVAHFITSQQLNGKVLPLVNAQYVVKPVVVVNTQQPTVAAAGPRSTSS